MIGRRLADLAEMLEHTLLGFERALSCGGDQGYARFLSRLAEVGLLEGAAAEQYQSTTSSLRSGAHQLLVAHSAAVPAQQLHTRRRFVREAPRQHSVIKQPQDQPAFSRRKPTSTVSSKTTPSSSGYAASMASRPCSYSTLAKALALIRCPCRCGVPLSVVG